MELTKEYFDQQLGTLARKEDLEHLASNVRELTTDVVAMHDDFRTMKSDITEIKQTLIELNKRDKEDSDAFAKTLVQNDERLTGVENNIKQLKLKQT
jgi:archaellum component FlaC